MKAEAYRFWSSEKPQNLGEPTEKLDFNNHIQKAGFGQKVFRLILMLPFGVPHRNSEGFVLLQ